MGLARACHTPQGRVLTKQRACTHRDGGLGLHVHVGLGWQALRAAAHNVGARGKGVIDVACGAHTKRPKPTSAV